MDEAAFRVNVSRWVRVLALLRVPFAVRRMRAARFMEWSIQKNQEAILNGVVERQMELIRRGWVETDRPCGTCGDRPANQRLMGGIVCRACAEKEPRLYGPGIAEFIVPPKETP